MKKNFGSKKKNREAAFRERQETRMQKEYREVIKKRQLEAAIDQGNFLTAARLMATTGD